MSLTLGHFAAIYDGASPGRLWIFTEYLLMAVLQNVMMDMVLFVLNRPAFVGLAALVIKTPQLNLSCTTRECTEGECHFNSEDEEVKEKNRLGALFGFLCDFTTCLWLCGYRQCKGPSGPNDIGGYMVGEVARRTGDAGACF